MTRVYSCAGHTRADAMRAASAQAVVARDLRGRQQHPLAQSPPLPADANQLVIGASMAAIAAGIGHPPLSTLISDEVAAACFPRYVQQRQVEVRWRQ